MSEAPYNIDPGAPKGGGDHGAPLPSMPVTKHGEDFVKDHAVADGPSTTQPVGSGS